MDDREPGPAPDLTTGELIARLSEQTSTLIRDEMRLAQAELGAKAKHAGVGLGMFGAGGLIGFFGLAAGIATAIIALGLLWPLWLAGLCVTVVLFAVAAIVALIGRSQVKSAGSLKPERAMHNLKKDVAEIKEHTGHEHT